MIDQETLAEFARTLEATEQFRVLRRMPVTVPLSSPIEGEPIYRGLVVDTETTGTDVQVDEPVEIALVSFDYGAISGRITRIVHAYQDLQEPQREFSEAAQRITGLSDADVRGQKINEYAVCGMFTEANVVIAHNSAFDRKIVERAWPRVPLRPWACSMTDIDWIGLGAQGRRLSDAIQLHGLFHVAHRAMADVVALLHILALPLPGTQENALARLLAAARRPSAIILADNLPFSASSTIRQRGYRWNPAAPKGWWRELATEQALDELKDLQATAYRGSRSQPRVAIISAVDRFRSLRDIADQFVPASTALQHH